MFYPSGQFINMRGSWSEVEQAEHETFLNTIVQGGDIFFEGGFFFLKYYVKKVLCGLQ